MNTMLIDANVMNPRPIVDKNFAKPLTISQRQDELGSVAHRILSWLIQAIGTLFFSPPRPSSTYQLVSSSCPGGQVSRKSPGTKSETYSLDNFCPAAH